VSVALELEVRIAPRLIRPSVITPLAKRSCSIPLHGQTYLQVAVRRHDHLTYSFFYNFNFKKPSTFGVIPHFMSRNNQKFIFSINGYLSHNHKMQPINHSYFAPKHTRETWAEAPLANAHGFLEYTLNTKQSVINRMGFPPHRNQSMNLKFVEINLQAFKICLLLSFFFQMCV